MSRSIFGTSTGGLQNLPGVMLTLERAGPPAGVTKYVTPRQLLNDRPKTVAADDRCRLRAGGVLGLPVEVERRLVGSDATLSASHECPIAREESENGRPLNFAVVVAHEKSVP